MDWSILDRFGGTAVAFLLALIGWEIVRRWPRKNGGSAPPQPFCAMPAELRFQFEESFQRLKDMETAINVNMQHIHANGERIQDIHRILSPERIGEAIAKTTAALQNIAELLAIMREILPIVRITGYGGPHAGPPHGAPFPEHQA